jgi:hypothetical protein
MYGNGGSRGAVSASHASLMQAFQANRLIKQYSAVPLPAKFPTATPAKQPSIKLAYASIQDV